MKVAIYCRLSEEDRNKVHKDDDSNSIKNQKAMLMQYAISQAELESHVITELRRLNQQLLDQTRVQREISFEASLNAQKERIASERKGYQDKVDELDFAIKQLYIDKTKGLINPKDFFFMNEGFQEEKAKFEALVRSCSERIADIEARIRIGDNRLELLEQYLGNDHLSRSVLEILVDHIEIGKRDKISKQVPVTIHWNF